MSFGNKLPLMDEMDEPGAFGNCTACVPGHVLAESSCADPAQLPGHANGLLDAGAPLLCWQALCWHLPLNLPADGVSLPPITRPKKGTNTEAETEKSMATQHQADGQGDQLGNTIEQASPFARPPYCVLSCHWKTYYHYFQ